MAELAGAVPLGDAATGSSPQQFEFQQRLDFRGGVAVDFTAEGDFFKIGARPDFRFHICRSPYLSDMNAAGMTGLAQPCNFLSVIQL